jgi:3',5'-cyclic AMP phosphodiesterase CpdA
MRIIQISDTHLSPIEAHFVGNWPPLAAWIEEQRPDLVIHTGDMTMDGADRAEDLRHGAALIRTLPVPVRAVPGNHDVGEAGNETQPVNAARLARWRADVGADWWFEDRGGWRLIGINGLLIGNGDDEEAAQAAWLDAVMAGAGGRRLAWFMHKPLFLDDPAEGDTGYWSIKPVPRRPWLDRIRRHDVALVATGHLHKAHQRTVDGTRYVWAPSSAFLCSPQIQPDMPGEKHVGAVLYEFDGDRVEPTIVEVPGLTTHWRPAPP